MGRLERKSIVLWGLRGRIPVQGHCSDCGVDMSCEKAWRLRLLVQRRNWKLAYIRLSHRTSQTWARAPPPRAAAGALSESTVFSPRQLRRKREGQEPVCTLSSTARKQNGRREIKRQESKRPKAAEGGREGHWKEPDRWKRCYVFIYITQSKS